MRILTKHQQFVIVSPMSNMNQINELSNESIKTAAAILLAGVLATGAAFIGVESYQALQVQPSVEQIHSDIVGPGHN